MWLIFSVHKDLKGSPQHRKLGFPVGALLLFGFPFLNPKSRKKGTLTSERGYLETYEARSLSPGHLSRVQGLGFRVWGLEFRG